MAHLRAQAFKEKQIIAMSPIENFINEVLQSNLQQETKDDVLKVMECFIYIRENISLIHWAIDHRDDLAVYKYKVSDPKRGIYSDKEKGVLRDYNDTAFHINSYTSGQQAEDILKGLIAQIEMYLTQLSQEQRLFFAEKLRFDGDIGCLEARIGPALTWAGETLSTPIPKLDDLMQKCYQEFQSQEQKEYFARYAEKYLQARNIEKCIIYNNIEISINYNLLKKYAVEILNELEELDVSININNNFLKNGEDKKQEKNLKIKTKK